jgi:type II secretory pathway component PulJ
MNGRRAQEYVGHRVFQNMLERKDARRPQTKKGTGHRTKTSWIKPTRKTKIRTTQTRTLTSMKKVETAINTIGTKQSQGPETKGPMVRSLAIGNR